MSELRERLLEVLDLKALPRAGWVRVGVPAPESVASHSWGVAWLVLALCPPGLDRGRALAIAVLHDLAEVRVGDITPHDGVPEALKHAREAEAMRGLLAPLPGGEELMALWQEYGESPEGRFVKACDKLDMALQAARYAETADTREFIDAALAKLPPGLLRELAG
ncbi:MAG: HD domain-containing protein [Alphaproteobacteria bacterium]|nr:HD domain-containing protein [Alphaproteobacteria bacterium]